MIDYWSLLVENLDINQITSLVTEHLNFVVLSVRNYLVDIVEQLLVALILYLTVCAVFYCCATKLNLFEYSKGIRNAKRVLFVIAHPDDEVMFFGPTILYYTSKPTCTVYIMCLSSGKNYGMNKVRTSELYNSCKILGVKEENIFVHNHSNLPDKIDVRWPVYVVSKSVLKMVEALSITNIITFDRDGVSGHPNHSSIYYSLANLIVDSRLPKNCGVYVLESVNILRKYSLFLDLPLSYLFSTFRFMDGFKQRKLIHKAMFRHKSQITWYRKLYMIFSRYMLINSLQQVNLVDIELDLQCEDE